MVTFTPEVELWVDEAWLDITNIDADTRVLAGTDGASGIQITRGNVGDEDNHIAPTSVQFTYLDNNSLLDGENPASIYYRKIVQGTKMRVTMDGDVRAVVKLSEWDIQPSTDGDGNAIVLVNVKGDGVLLDLQSQSTEQPLRSVAYRALSAAENDDARIFYVPLEDERETNQIATFGIGPGNAFTYNDVTLGGGAESNSTARTALLGEDGWIIVTPPPYESEEHKLCMLWRSPEEGLSEATSAPVMIAVEGSIETIEFQIEGNNARLRAFNGGIVADETSLFDLTGYIDGGQEFFFTIELNQNGADLDVAFLIVREDGEAVVPTGTWTGTTVTRVVSWWVGFVGCAGSSVGQMILGNDTNAFNNYINGNSYARGTTGFLREPAAVRIDRITNEETGISPTIVGSAGDTILLGPQGTSGTEIDVIDDAALADHGILADDREDLALWYRTRSSMYNQLPTLEISLEHLQPGYSLNNSRVGLTNHVTASRDGGSTDEYSIPDDDPWHWTTQEPPDGAGPRKSSITPNVWSDEQLNDQAAWVAHIAAWREKRASTVRLELAKDSFTPAQRQAARATDLGDLISTDLTDAPAWAPYTEIRQIVRGYTEELSKLAHTITFNTAPADPYEVEVVTAGPTSIIAAPVSDSATSIKIAPGDGMEWSTADEPYHINVDGDPMTVTAITTDTPTFIAAGAVSYADNASVSPALPAGMTVDVGQALVCVAFCRQTGSGQVSTTPTGWEDIARSPDGDWAIFGRYYRTGDTALTVTFTGGSAGNTTGAVVLGWSGLSIVPDKNVRSGYPNGYARTVNASAQNIAYPALPLRRANSLGVIVGKKDDDWTSVAQVTTERVDSSSTTGNDIGIVINTSVPGTAGSTIASGTLTVTGGAAAVSEGFVVGIRPLQTATVTRGIAGLAVAHTIGDTVHAWRPGFTGL